MKACILIIVNGFWLRYFIDKLDIFSIFNQAINDNIKVHFKSEPKEKIQYVLTFYDYDNAKTILSKYGYKM